MNHLLDPLRGVLALSCLGASLLFAGCNEPTQLTSTELAAQATVSESESTEGTTSEGTDAGAPEETVCPEPWTPPEECLTLRAELAACHEAAEASSAAARAQAEACWDGIRAQCAPLVEVVHTCLEAGASDCAAERTAAEACRAGAEACLPLDEAVRAAFESCRTIAESLDATCRPPAPPRQAEVCDHLAAALAACRADEACAPAPGEPPPDGDRPAAGDGRERPAPGDGERPLPPDGERPAAGEGERPLPPDGERPAADGARPGPGAHGPRGCFAIAEALRVTCGAPDEAGPGERPAPGERPEGERPLPGERPEGERPLPGERPEGDRPAPGERPEGDRPAPGDRPDGG